MAAAPDIRDYVVSDFEAVCRVHDAARPLELAGSCDPAAFVPLAEDRDDLAHFEWAEKLVARDGDRVVGFAGTDGSTLGWLYVDPPSHRRGIGRRLLRAALERTGPDARTIVLAGNASASALYRSEGFVVAREFVGDNAGHSCRAFELTRGDPLETFDRHWDFDDPETSERRFRALLPLAVARAERGEPGPARELRTQIARTHSLRRQFDEARAILDEVEAGLEDAASIARVRWRLEHGRTHNSAAERDAARPFFVDAWEEARTLGADALAVDAAHMVALVEEEAESIRWNERALALADSSTDERARRWRGSLGNNLGWTHHEAGRFGRALELFGEALTAREEQGKIEEIRVARWCFARCLRSLGRLDEALAIQQSLRDERRADGREDRFVDEEIEHLTRPTRPAGGKA